MLVKICGLFDRNNIKEVCQHQPDFIGCIFYPKSPRFIEPQNFYLLRDAVTESVKVVGVFVSESSKVILDVISNGALDGVQLYGDNASFIAEELREKGFLGIIILSVPATLVSNINPLLLNVADYLLIDYPTKDFGGSGESFDWNILQETEIQKPFFLSGGLGAHNIENALQHKIPNLIGFDFNSRLEDQNRIKDITQVKKCIETVRNYESR